MAVGRKILKVIAHNFGRLSQAHTVWDAEVVASCEALNHLDTGNHSTHVLRRTNFMVPGSLEIQQEFVTGVRMRGPSGKNED